MDLSDCMGLDPLKVTRPCAMGVDIRPDSWDICVLDVLKGKSGLHVPRLVFYGKVDDEKAVEWLAPQYATVCAVLDSRPEATLANRLQKKLQGRGTRCWRASYNTTPSDIEYREDHVEGVIRMDRTMTLDRVHYAFLTGNVALPQNYDLICHEKFKSELTNCARVPWIYAGREWAQWVNKGPDHAFHAFNYALMAVHLGRLMTYGGEATMGASPGIVESVLSRNIVTAQDQMDQDQMLEGTMTWVA